MSLRCVLFDLDNVYSKFYKEKIGFPRYNNKYGGDHQNLSLWRSQDTESMKQKKINHLSDYNSKLVFETLF